MSILKHVTFDFGHKLEKQPGAENYTCPVCHSPDAVKVDLADSSDIGFSCSNGCGQPAILQALGVDPHAIICLNQQFPANLTPVKKETRQRLTWESLLCEMALHGWSVSFNIITQEIEIDARTVTSNRQMSMDDLITVLHSDLAGKYKGCTLDTLHAYVSYIARENSVNPVLDLLSTVQWDGHDRLPDLFQLMGISDDDLSKTLVSKWLLQTVALLFNDESAPFGADGVLVLNGGQGVGKTSLFQRLALRSQWFGEGATIKDNDKDTVRRCITKWITELGEVESTLKSDISALKAFVTSDVDVYRTPYARSDRKAARRTSLCATCNSDRYLIDPTGNRRWWSVPIRNVMPYDEIQKFDALQLWGQLYQLVAPLSQEERSACFRLSQSEQKQLAARNGDFEKPVKAETECRDLLEDAKAKNLTWTLMSVTEWKQENLDVLRPYSVQQIGEALKKIGIQADRDHNKRGYILPTKVLVPSEILKVI